MRLFRHRGLDGCRCYVRTKVHWLTILVLYSDTAVMSILHFFANPHSWTPYVHAGRSICLYKSSLLYIDSSDRRPSRQYIFRNLVCSSPCFFLICAYHRSLASSAIPRYFAVLAGGILTPLRRIDRWSIFWLVKLIYVDLDPLSLMRHLRVQVAILSLTCCSFVVDSSSVFPVAIIAVSFANVAIVQFNVPGKSLI
jgi:hypothetical protein